MSPLSVQHGLLDSNYKKTFLIPSVQNEKKEKKKMKGRMSQS